jgi:hypothetical protein
MHLKAAHDAIARGRPMKYRVQIYDEEYLIQAKALDGAIRGAVTRYAHTSPSAVFRHSRPSRISRYSTFADDRMWEETEKGQRGPVHHGRWRKCRYIIGVTPIVVCAVEATEEPRLTKPPDELAAA